MLSNGFERGFTDQSLKKTKDSRIGRDKEGFFIYTSSENIKVYINLYYKFLEKTEKRALAVYLARVGGRSDAGIENTPAAGGGSVLYEDQCSICHGEGSDWPIARMVGGRPVNELYDLIGRLPEVNDMMPEFEGTDDERRELAGHLARLGSTEGTR